MDPGILLDLLDNFEIRRAERFTKAQELIAQYQDNPDDLLVDFANVLMLLYAANQMARSKATSHEFKPSSTDFRSDTR